MLALSLPERSHELMRGRGGAAQRVAQPNRLLNRSGRIRCRFPIGANDGGRSRWRSFGFGR